MVVLISAHPRMGFCIFAPVFAVFLLKHRKNLHKFIVMMGLFGILFWAVPVFSNLDDSSSSSGSLVSFGKNIRVKVTVQRGYFSPGEYWKFGCEYKLYANDQCIATKNSKSMSVDFEVTVPKGASLRAEMLSKNGFGGTELKEGPPGWENAVANEPGQRITIRCF